MSKFYLINFLYLNMYDIKSRKPRWKRLLINLLKVIQISSIIFGRPDNFRERKTIFESKRFKRKY